MYSPNTAESVGESVIKWVIAAEILFLLVTTVLGRTFVKWSPYAIRLLSVCLSCPVCDIGVLRPNGWMDQDETWHAGRPRPWPHCFRCGPSFPSPKLRGASNFRPISVVAKWLDGSRCHLVWRKDSAQATFC